MDPLVPLELTGSKEVLAALGAVKRPLTRVDALVALEPFQAREALVALVAVVGFFPGVNPPVLFQVT